jgi:hypothetical protein
MTNPSDADVNFYALVHHVLEASREFDESADRRVGRRRTYSCLQWIAPYRDGRLPDGSDFRRVQCVDLSSSGFSFIAEDSCDFDFLIVSLGTPALLVSAEVVSRSPADDTDGVRVGCRFVAKIDDTRT